MVLSKKAVTAQVTIISVKGEQLEELQWNRWKNCSVSPSSTIGTAGRTPVYSVWGCLVDSSNLSSIKRGAKGHKAGSMNPRCGRLLLMRTPGLMTGPVCWIHLPSNSKQRSFSSVQVANVGPVGSPSTLSSGALGLELLCKLPTQCEDPKHLGWAYLGRCFSLSVNPSPLSAGRASCVARCALICKCSAKWQVAEHPTSVCCNLSPLFSPLLQS